jgi:hypothetical protein
MRYSLASLAVLDDPVLLFSAGRLARVTSLAVLDDPVLLFSGGRLARVTIYSCASSLKSYMICIYQFICSVRESEWILMSEVILDYYKVVYWSTEFTNYWLSHRQFLFIAMPVPSIVQGCRVGVRIALVLVGVVLTKVNSGTLLVNSPGQRLVTANLSLATRKVLSVEDCIVLCMTIPECRSVSFGHHGNVSYVCQMNSASDSLSLATADSSWDTWTLKQDVSKAKTLKPNETQGPKKENGMYVFSKNVMHVKELIWRMIGRA